MLLNGCDYDKAAEPRHAHTLLPSVTGSLPVSQSYGDEEEPVPAVTGCQQQYMTHPIFWDWSHASSHPLPNKWASTTHRGEMSQRERWRETKKQDDKAAIKGEKIVGIKGVNI